MSVKTEQEEEAQAITNTNEVNHVAETSDFLGPQQSDYQGRTYMHIPRDQPTDLSHDPDIKNFVPKKYIHTWQCGPSKAITSLKLFPNSGHLLLSASADSKILLWDVYRQKELLRAYRGHTNGITDLDFSSEGTAFLSASHDGSIKHWDVETGLYTARFGNPDLKNTPYVVRHKPNSSHEFLAGVGSSILQFDTRTPKSPVLEYEYHTKAVNTLCFYGSNNEQFASTSDDGSIRLWEYGTPVPDKLIASPDMFAITRSAVHRSGKYICYQCSDNKIEAYSTSERKFRPKKSFRGHQTVGYAVDVVCSPGGRIVAGGDSRGFL
ncbi:WD40-repeat-containing domain protein [Lophiotrema nucula]|uniref:WD40-repeat-containing domain protein n=1 Tax=Lophiotrema nucula TaxID=690887 RepID=A0A6A5Z6V8_9PLEO|nr:WD40-repeat-containing domain protein [Lophiotrema nucula]